MNHDFTISADFFPFIAMACVNSLSLSILSETDQCVRNPSHHVQHGTVLQNHSNSSNEMMEKRVL